MGSPAVAFDLDGTLVDSRRGIDWAAAQAFAAELPDEPAPVLSRHIGPPVGEMLRRALPGKPDATIAALTAGFRRHYDAGGYRLTEPYPDVRAVLEELSPLAPLFVVTNKPARPTAAILATLGLRDLFTDVMSPDSVPGHGTKGDALRFLCNAYHLDRARTVYVGDSSDDRAAAAGAGVRFVAVRHGYGDAALDAAPDDLGVVDGLAGLPPLVVEFLRAEGGRP